VNDWWPNGDRLERGLYGRQAGDRPTLPWHGARPEGIDRGRVGRRHGGAHRAAPGCQSRLERRRPFGPLAGEVAPLARIGREVEEFDPAVFEMLDELSWPEMIAAPGRPP
jgi:hypothetical protein